MLGSIGAFGVYRPDNLFLYLRITDLGILIFLSLLPHVQVILQFHPCMYVCVVYVCMHTLEARGLMFNVSFIILYTLLK